MTRWLVLTCVIVFWGSRANAAEDAILLGIDGGLSRNQAEATGGRYGGFAGYERILDEVWGIAGELAVSNGPLPVELTLQLNHYDKYGTPPMLSYGASAGVAEGSGRFAPVVHANVGIAYRLLSLDVGVAPTERFYSVTLRLDLGRIDFLMHLMSGIGLGGTC